MGANRPWFIIAGGGTAGHLYPGLAVAEAMRAMQPDLDVTIFGTPRSIDDRLSKSYGYELDAQTVQPFPSRPWQWPAFLKHWFRSVKHARKRFTDRQPCAVLGLGGYAAGPAVVAAAKMGIPTALFNPDAVPGKANQQLGPKVDRVFVQWSETAKHFGVSADVRCTGCPIRPEFGQATHKQACRHLKLTPEKKTLLITGASQGAHSINAAVMELFDVWSDSEDWQIIHLTGEADFTHCRAMYFKHKVDAKTYAYTEHMALCMVAADIIISRAGASTLAEITAMGRAPILMPYPYDRKQHQLANAKVLVDNHAAALVTDADDPHENSYNLREVLSDLMRSDERRRRMSQATAALGRHDAAEAIAGELFEMIERHG